MFPGPSAPLARSSLRCRAWSGSPCGSPHALPPIKDCARRSPLSVWRRAAEDADGRGIRPTGSQTRADRPAISASSATRPGPRGAGRPPRAGPQGSQLPSEPGARTAHRASRPRAASSSLRTERKPPRRAASPGALPGLCCTTRTDPFRTSHNSRHFRPVATTPRRTRRSNTMCSRSTRTRSSKSAAPDRERPRGNDRRNVRLTNMTFLATDEFRPTC